MQFPTFLINDRQDANGFSMDWEAIKQGAKHWIGVPGVLKCSDVLCDHTEGQTLQDAQRISERHKVTEIIDVKLDEKTHTAFALHNVTSNVNQDLCQNLIKSVSQSVWLDREPPNPKKIHVTENDGYTPIHLAFVTYGAYDPASLLPTNTCKLFNTVQSSRDMEEKPKEPEKENQAMSMQDEIHEIHSMLKAMTSQKEPEKEVQSSVKPSLNFAWPQQESEKPILSCDLKH